MTASSIEWTDETWNPTVGCSRVSPGCDHCYAIGAAHRAMQPAHVGLTKKTERGIDWTGEVRQLPDRLDTPLHWRRPRRVFVNSMSDLFHPEVPSDLIRQVFEVMGEAKQHTFQVLTKRPARMRAWVQGERQRRREYAAQFELCPTDAMRNSPAARWAAETADEVSPNVWLGTSIESDRYAWRADHLRATPAAKRFLSLEPLLGPLPSLDLTGIDWVIVGGESGPGARPMHPGWARDIRDRCVAAGVPFFFKQWGSWAPTGTGWTKIDAGAMRYTRQLGPGAFRYVEDSGEATHALAATEENSYERMSRLSKAAAGRFLDGRTWDEMPETVSA